MQQTSSVLTDGVDIEKDESAYGRGECMTKPKRQIPVAGTKPAPQVYFRIDRPEPRVVDDAPNWRDRVREIVTPIWFDYHGTHFFDGDGKMIAQIRGWGGLTSSGLSDEEARQVQEKNAAFIVNAVNEYDALVAENEALKVRLASASLYIRKVVDAVNGGSDE